MKVGEYIRTKHYGISKIIDIYNEDKIELDKENAFGIKGVCYMVENLIKSSPNIIDLIEVGDYVNGYRVIDFDYSVANTRIRIWIDTENEINYIFKNDIKSVVTKEHFLQMEYRIGE